MASSGFILGTTRPTTMAWAGESCGSKTLTREQLPVLHGLTVPAGNLFRPLGEPRYAPSAQSVLT